MSRWLTEWRSKRWLRKLGPIELGAIETCVRYAERKQSDAMPCMWQVSFCTIKWIQANKALPQVGRSRLGGVR